MNVIDRYIKPAVVNIAYAMLTTFLLWLIIYIYKSVHSDLAVDYSLVPISLPCNNTSNVPEQQMMAVNITLDSDKDIYINKIEISPCSSIFAITYLVNDELHVDPNKYEIKKSDANNFKILIFKGLQKLTVGSKKVTLIYWGVFGRESDIYVKLYTSSQGVVCGVKRVYVSNELNVLIKYKYFILIIFCSTIITIILFYRWNRSNDAK